MQGKDLPLPPTTTDGHPVEGTNPSIKSGGGSMITSSSKSPSASSSSNPYAGKVGA